MREAADGQERGKFDAADDPMSAAEDAWARKRAEVGQLADRLGAGIDEGIRDTVAGLALAGIATCQSCEGHLDHGAPYPWVDIREPGIPAERFVGELDAMKRQAELRGVALDEVLRDEDGLAHEAHEAAWHHIEEAGTLATAAYAEWRERNADLRRRVRDLLDEFYDDRDRAQGVGLIVEQAGLSARIRSEGAVERLHDHRPDERELLAMARCLEACRREMAAFTLFLRERFLAAGGED